MKLTLARADLHRALALVGRAVERRNTIPILSNVRLAAGDGALTLTATDLDLMIVTSIPAAVEQAGAVTASAAVLGAYIAKLADPAQVAIHASNGRAGIRSGRARADLGTLDATDFPDLAAGEMSHSFELPGRDLARLLGVVEFAISTEETRYYLNGIYLHAPDGTSEVPVLRAVATDGHRLARAELPAPHGAEGMPGVIVPRKAVGELKRIAEAAGDAGVTVSISATKIALSTGSGWGTSLVSKLIDGTFPDYARVIPAGNPNVATLPAADLARAIDRVSAVSAERGRAIKLAFAADALTLRMNNPDQGEAEDEIGCAFVGDELQIGCNARYAADILAALDAKEVAIAMADPGAPMVWTSPADPTRLYVLMPMRV